MNKEKTPKALCDLGACYELGQDDFNAMMGVASPPERGIMKNINLAANLYYQSAQLDNVQGMINLACLIFKCGKNNKMLGDFKREIDVADFEKISYENIIDS